MSLLWHGPFCCYHVGMENLTKALIEAQKEFAPLKKSATNPHFRNKFVPLHEVLSSVLPILNKNGLAIAQFPNYVDDQPVLTTHLLHQSGEFMAASMPLMMAKSDPQGQGSAITYARRYAIMSILGIVGDEDDDGQKGTTAVAYEKNVQSVAATELELAKNDLRAAIKKAGVDPQDYAWVAKATPKEIENIRGVTAALKLGNG